MKHALTPARLASVAGLTGALLLPVCVATAPLHAVAAAQEQSFGDRVVAEAASHDGKDYEYGATGPGSFDCSGYVQYVFAQLGKRLPRTSGDQYAASQKVGKADKRPGDLIAIHSSSGRVTHVALYAGGGDMWVASTGSDRVRLQAIYTDRYRVGRFG
ncbi:MAG: hydrolase [Frankiales bacterium]|jgi:cell wall-associated NlpC family hydrolase|nr:hydrolase [Frankiales bacterium]